jgi:4-amino-4-deoxy-L-arabinose transferase-like glycosyltransferase
LGFNRPLWWDEVVYLSLGKSILDGKYGIPPGRDVFRPVIFPSIIALSFLLDGEVLVRMTIGIFSVLSIITAYYLGKELFDEKVGCLSAVFLSSFPSFIFFGNKILSEVVFLTTSSLAIATFYVGVEKEKKFLYLSAFLTGISILTKYFGFFLLAIYFFYILLKKRIRFFREKETFVSLAILFFTLTPWFIINTFHYGNPIGGIFENARIYLSLPQNHPFYFFLIDSWKIFGLAAIFIPFGIYYSVKKIKSNILLTLIYCTLPFLVFSSMQHKELRYLASFLPAFSCLMAFAVRNIPKRLRTITYCLIVVMFVFGFYTGYKNVIEERVNSDVLKEGSVFIKQLTDAEEYVMSESYPYISYYANRVAIRPPNDKKIFYDLLREYNITYVLVDVTELGNPDYLLEELKTENFKEIKSFSNQQKTVIVYEKL